jgi:WD40-like Beta Propeller Repeat
VRYWTIPIVLWLGVSLWLAFKPRGVPEQILYPWTEVRPTLSWTGERAAFEVDSSDDGSEPRAFGRQETVRTDIVLLDRVSGDVRRLSRASGSNRSPSLSGDGQTLVFEGTNASKHQSDVYIVSTETLEMETVKPDWRSGGRAGCFAPSIASRSQTIAMLSYVPVDQQPLWEPVVVQCEAGEPSETLRPFPLAIGSAEGMVSLSPDGKSAAWESRDLSEAGKIKVRLLLSEQGALPVTIHEGGFDPSLSEGICVFSAPGPEGFYQIGLFDLHTRTTTFLTQGNDDCLEPKISGDGSSVVFTSYATNLVEGDHNGCSDVFLYTLATGAMTNLTSQGDGNSYNPAISGDGSTVAFASLATNLSGQTLPAGQVYVWERGWQRCEVLPVRADL